MEPTQPPTQQPVQNPIQVPSLQPKPNYLKTIIFSVLIIITLSLITYLVFQNQKLQKQVLNPQISPTIQVPSPTPQTVSSISIPSDETAEWKTYSDSINNFFFKCPSNWYLGKNLDFDGKVELGECSIVYSGKFSFDDGGIVTIGFVPDSIAKIEQGGGSFELNRIKNQPNGKTYSNNGFNGWFSMKNDQNLISIIARKDTLNGYYEFTALAVGNTKTDQEYKDIFDQILSTFKFIDTNESPKLSEEILIKGWYWGSEDQKKPGTPDDWVYKEAGRSSCWHRLGIECR